MESQQAAWLPAPGMWFTDDAGADESREESCDRSNANADTQDVGQDVGAAILPKLPHHQITSGDDAGHQAEISDRDRVSWNADADVFTPGCQQFWASTQGSDDWNGQGVFSCRDRLESSTDGWSEAAAAAGISFQPWGDAGQWGGDESAYYWGDGQAPGDENYFYNEQSSHRSNKGGAGLLKDPVTNRPYRSHGMVPRRSDLTGQFKMHKDAGQEVTTMMIRNVPNRYTRSMLMEELDAAGYEDTYDFVYIPIDNATKWNVGYAFVNFEDSESCQRCMHDFGGREFKTGTWKNPNPSKRPRLAQVAVAHLQGLRNNLAHISGKSIFFLPDPQTRPWVKAWPHDLPIPCRSHEHGNRQANYYQSDFHGYEGNDHQICWEQDHVVIKNVKRQEESHANLLQRRGESAEAEPFPEPPAATSAASAEEELGPLEDAEDDEPRHVPEVPARQRGRGCPVATCASAIVALRLAACGTRRRQLLNVPRPLIQRMQARPLSQAPPMPTPSLSASSSPVTSYMRADVSKNSKASDPHDCIDLKEAYAERKRMLEEGEADGEGLWDPWEAGVAAFSAAFERQRVCRQEKPWKEVHDFKHRNRSAVASNKEETESTILTEEFSAQVASLAKPRARSAPRHRQRSQRRSQVNRPRHQSGYGSSFEWGNDSQLHNADLASISNRHGIDSGQQGWLSSEGQVIGQDITAPGQWDQATPQDVASTWQRNILPSPVQVSEHDMRLCFMCPESYVLQLKNHATSAGTQNAIIDTVPEALLWKTEKHAEDSEHDRSQSATIKGIHKDPAAAMPRDNYVASDNASCTKEVTSIILQNVPHHLKQEDVLNELSCLKLNSSCDFLYLPSASQEFGYANAGFAILNFRSEEESQHAIELLSSHLWQCDSEHTDGMEKKKVKVLVDIAAIQGLEDNILHFCLTFLSGAPQDEHQTIPLVWPKPGIIMNACWDLLDPAADCALVNYNSKSNDDSIISGLQEQFPTGLSLSPWALAATGDWAGCAERLACDAVEHHCAAEFDTMLHHAQGHVDSELAMAPGNWDLTPDADESCDAETLHAMSSVDAGDTSAAIAETNSMQAYCAKNGAAAAETIGSSVISGSTAELQIVGGVISGADTGAAGAEGSGRHTLENSSAQSSASSATSSNLAQQGNAKAKSADKKLLELPPLGMDWPTLGPQPARGTYASADSHEPSRGRKSAG